MESAMIERRYIESEIECRGKDSGATLAGYAAVFNSPTVIAGLFREQVAPRAFSKSLREHDVRALFNHDPNIVLGRKSAGTLRLSTDDHGLHYEVDLPDTQQARDLWVSVERGDVTQSSFAFEAVKDSFEDEDGELPLRTIREVRLYDVSPVTYPAYEDTEVVARASEVLRRARSPEERAVPPLPLLPIGEKGQGWDAAAAKRRVQEWAGGDDWDPAKYRRAFLWYDASNPELLGSYKMPIGDVRGGSLVAVPEGIYAAAQRFDMLDVPDKDAVRARINAYYAKMGEESPLLRSATTQEPEEPPTAQSAGHSATQEPEPAPRGMSIYIARLNLIAKADGKD